MNNRQLTDDFIEKHTTEQIKSLIEKTRKIDIIPRYFMIDAVLSKKFKISIEDAMSVWKRELQEVAKIHNLVKNLDIPRVFKCARFALYVLKHLLVRGTQQTVCSYSLVARNFIVALVKTNNCLCVSYTMYVQACANYFGYNDHVSTCSLPSHIFTIIKNKHQDSDFVIAIDAGFPNNTHIAVTNNSKKSNVKQLLDWDDNFFKWRTFSENYADCEEYTHRQQKAAYLLYQEAIVKTTFEKSLRNCLIVKSLAPREMYIKDCVNFSLAQQQFYRNLFFCEKNSNYDFVVEAQNLDFLSKKLQSYNLSLQTPKSISYDIYTILYAILPGLEQGLFDKNKRWNFVYKLFNMIYKCLKRTLGFLSFEKIQTGVFVYGNVSKGIIQDIKKICFIEVMPTKLTETSMFFENSAVFYKNEILVPKSKINVFLNGFEFMTSKYVIHFYDFKYGIEPDLLYFDQVFRY